MERGHDCKASSRLARGDAVGQARRANVDRTAIHHAEAN